MMEYTRLVEGVLVDGIITKDERAFLQKKAAELNLDSWLADQIEETSVEQIKSTLGELPKEE